MEAEENSNSTVTPCSFGDNPVLNAVHALLLSSQQHRPSKGDVLPTSAQLLLLTKSQSKSTMEANLGSGLGNGCNKADNFDAFIPSLEQVHALATANLLASTQRDIAQQLAEASSNSETQTQTNKRHQGRASPNKKKDITKKFNPPESDIITSVPKALTCSFNGCKRKFASATHLKYHEMTHTDNRQFECPDENCAKTFYTAQRLKVHLRTHTGEKPFKCSHEDCGKTFTTAGNLKNHKRIHTGEQPFMCDFDGCDRRFTEYSSLHKHKLTHSGDKPFECKICNKKFTQSGSRRQHLIRHHLDEEIRNSLKASRYNKIDSFQDVTERNSKTVTEVHDQINAKSASTVSCSPQLITLSNDFHSQTSSESIVGDHFVSLMSGSNHHVSLSSSHRHHQHQHLTESSNISSSHPLLNGVYEVTLDNKPSELVALSQASVFHSEEQGHGILCASDMLDNEEITHANYVSQESVPEELVTPLAYHSHHHNDIHIQTDVSLHHSCESHHSGPYQNHQDYIQDEDLNHPNTEDYHTEVKVGKMSSSYLTPDGEVLHEEFIGTKEVTISSSSGPGDITEEDPSYIYP